MFALLGLYPFLVALLGVFTTGILFVSTSINVVLTTLCVALYMMIPVGSFDHWFSSVSQLVQMTFPKQVGRFLSNLRETFEYHEVSPPEKALYLWHPHGLLTIAPFYHTFVQERSKIVCLSFFHKLPVIRDLYHYMRAIPSDYKTMKDALETESISVIPGGVREMLKTQPGTFKTVLRDRSGVFRLALQTGTPIVPVVTIGENELFRSIEHPLWSAFNQWLYSSWGLCIPIPTLDSVLHWAKLSTSPLPPVRTYAGKPIHLDQMDEPTDEAIAALRERYLRRLSGLYSLVCPRGPPLEVE